MTYLRTTTPDQLAANTEPADPPSMMHWLAPTPGGRTLNAMTIDLEDWPIAVLGPDHDVTGHVVENTKRVLQVLSWHHVRATFFVLTKVALCFPELIQEIHAAGHEIASHGHGHELLTRISPRRFEQDVRLSIQILTDLVGTRPIGYRAPAFSIVEDTRWAGPILAGLGFKYSSSIFPIQHPRYGIPSAPRGFHRWQGCGLIECPPATARIMGRNLPVAGGGYLRLLPGGIVRWAIHRMNKNGMPAVLYLHPYELDIHGVSEHAAEGVQMGAYHQLTQGLFRSRIEHRLHRLMEKFSFAPLREVLQHAL